jgi:hypothetical protein
VCSSLYGTTRVLACTIYYLKEFPNCAIFFRGSATDWCRVSVRRAARRDPLNIMASSPYVWLPGGGQTQDEHGAFRLTFTTSAANTQVSIDHVGISWYNIFVDGAYAAEGPTRFMGPAPFSATTTVTLPAPGKHVVAIHVHSAGVQTRFLLSTPPALYCNLVSTDPAGHPISAVAWKCASLSPGTYEAGAARVSVLLGWVERCSVSMPLQQVRCFPCMGKCRKEVADTRLLMAPSFIPLVAPNAPRLFRHRQQ